MVIHQLVLLLSLAVAAPSDKGSLRIQSAPGTEVIWEGVSLDATDANGILNIANIPAGRFNLVLKKRGFTTEKRVVEIGGGETVTLTVSLSAASPPKDASSRGAERRPPNPKAGKGVAEQARPAAAKKGRVPLWPTLSNETPVGTPSLNLGTVSLLVLIPAALLILIYMFRRVRPAGPGPHPPLISGSGPQEPAHRDGPKSAPFLRDLRRREELLEQGVEIIPPPSTAGRVIDLDSTKVREVKE